MSKVFVFYTYSRISNAQTFFSFFTPTVRPYAKITKVAEKIGVGFGIANTVMSFVTMGFSIASMIELNAGRGRLENLKGE